MGRGVGSWGMREGEYKHGMESVVVLSGQRALKNCLVVQSTKRRCHVMGVYDRLLSLTATDLDV